MTGRLRRVATGAVVGLTWSAALRAWMVELAGAESTFTWWTVALVLAPATVTGGVCGWSWARRSEGMAPPRWAPWSPALLASAVAAPEVFRALVSTGEGSGALMVAGAGAAGAFAFSGHTSSRGRRVALGGWLLGVAAVGATGTIAGSPLTPRGALVCGTGAALVALLGVALAVNHPGGPALGPTDRRVALAGAVAAAAASATLVLTAGRPWSALATVRAPEAIWLGSFALGLVLSGAAAVAWWRSGPPGVPRGPGVLRGGGAVGVR